MSAGGPDDGDAESRQTFANVGAGAQPVTQVVLVDDFLQALGDRLEVTAGEAAVRGKTFGQDEARAGGGGKTVVVEREPAADVGEGVFLG